LSTSNIATLEQQIEQINEEFLKGGGSVQLLDEWTIKAIGSQNEGVFILPTVVKSNSYRLPGWFLAGIWDYLRLPSIDEYPDVGHLTGWDFSQRGRMWLKSVTRNSGEKLIYIPERNELAFYPNDDSRVVLMPFPTKSICHAQQLFEEEGWLNIDDSPMASLSIVDYLRK
jgi:hypothetical protein